MYTTIYSGQITIITKTRCFRFYTAIMNQKMTIHGHSTALFATWFFLEELGILLDGGDGISMALGQKAGKVKHVFITHADRDHLTGLLQFVQLNARENGPSIYYPKDCGSFPAMESFSNKFDAHTSTVNWVPIEENQSIAIKPGVHVQSIRNEHVKTAGNLCKSLGYKIVASKRKLKAKFESYKNAQIESLVKEYGKNYITQVQESVLLAYSGDTPVFDPQIWDDCNILIHEATFIGTDKNNIKLHGNLHSTLTEVITMTKKLNIEKLVLTHFSSRYSPEFIRKSVQELCEIHQITVPVYLVLPGRTYTDILSEEPIYNNTANL